MNKKIALAFLLFTALAFSPKEYSYTLAVLKYNGGGDWYSNPSSLENLARFANKNLNAEISPDYATVEASSSDIFNYPYVHMTGHGNVVFNDQEIKNLRTYLSSGGFLHIDDNYGMDKFIRKELAKLFPDRELEALSSEHPIFHQQYEFPDGLPKIHEHDNQPPAAYVIRIEGKIALLYTVESDLGDGWEDGPVHNDPEEVRLKALKMGSNILQYVFSGQS